MTNTQAAAWLRDALREDHDMREYTGKALMSDHRRSVYLVCLRALQSPHQDGAKTHINEHCKQEHVLQEHALGRIDIPPGFDSVRANQCVICARERANQCVICAREMPEGNHVCGLCRGGRMTHLSLFSGIGGLDLAAEWAGFTTVGQCEWADYPTKVLEKHWPDVPRWRDIRTLTKESFYERTGRATVDVISGGFPCQPFSVAGKQKGKEDNRYLWPEMLRVIRELKPHYVVGENVPGIINIAADEVCADLEREGYEVRIFNFEAAAVGAPHRRARVAFVAHAKRDGFSGCKEAGSFDEAVSEEQAGQDNTLNTTGTGSIRRDVAYADEQGLQRRCETRNACGERTDIDKQLTRCGNGGRWWAVEPNVGGGFDGLSEKLDGTVNHWADGWEDGIPRVAHGVKSRVDRLKCLGNAVVPQQFYPIFKAIAELEGI